MNINLEEAVDDFLLSYKGLRKSPKTIESYYFDLKLLLEFIKGSKDIKNIDEDIFKRSTMLYLDTLTSYGEKEYETSSLNRKRIAIRRFIIFLYKREYIEKDFSGFIELLKQNKSAEKAVLNENEVTDCYKVLKSKTNTAKTEHKLFISIRNIYIFLTFLYTGVRVDELVHIKWININLDSNYILIEKGKGNKPRTVPINPELLEAFTAYKDYLLHLFPKNKSIFNGYLFFRNEKSLNTPLSTKTVRRIIENTTSDANIEKKITPHSIRHTFASHGIRNNMSIPVLASILGHSKNSITLDIYAHIINDMQKQEEMNKISFKSISRVD